MATIKMIPRKDLKTEFFVRKKLDDDYVIQLGELYEAGIEIPPILAVEGDAPYSVMDGRHRLAAHDLLNRDLVPVKFVRDASRAELLCAAFTANYGGPRPPSREDIEFTIEQLMEQGYGQAKIADALPFPKTLVRKYIANISSNVRRRKVSAAATAVVEGELTVSKAAAKYGIEPDDLKAILSGKKKKKVGVGDLKGIITSRFRSTSLKNASQVRKVLDLYEDGQWTEKSVRAVLDHVASCIKGMQTSHHQWIARFDSLLKDEEKADSKKSA